MHRIALLLSVGFVFGCATEESTFTGSLAVDSFPSDATGVVAVSSDATEVLAAVDAAGAFTLALPTEDTYSFFVETADGRIPVALRVSGESFGSVLDLGMGAATIDLGELTYHSNITVKADVEAPETTEPPTISEDADVVCEDGDEGASDARAADGDGHHGKGKHGGKGKGNDVTDVLLTDAPAFVLPTYALELQVGCGC